MRPSGWLAKYRDIDLRHDDVDEWFEWHERDWENPFVRAIRQTVEDDDLFTGRTEQ